MCRLGRFCGFQLNYPASALDYRYFLRMSRGKSNKLSRDEGRAISKNLKNVAEDSTVPPKIPADIPKARLDSRNRITVPKNVLAGAGLKPGDFLHFEVVSAGAIRVSRYENPILQFAGIFSGLYEGFDLRKDRDSWDS